MSVKPAVRATGWPGITIVGPLIGAATGMASMTATVLRVWETDCPPLSWTDTVKRAGVATSSA